MKTKKIIQYGQIIVGSFLIAAAVNWFIEPNGLNSGGLIGLAQILSFLLTGGSALTGIINLSINVPLFILSFRSISRSFFYKTLLSVGLQSFLFTVLPVLSEPVMPDILSNCIFAAVLGGVGIGLCLLASGCSGGLDILGVYLTSKASNFSVGKLSYVINFFVLAWSAILFSLPLALYSILMIMTMYFVSDKVHFQNINVFAIIITSNPQVKKDILEQGHRGVTFWNGYGAYTNGEKEILLCIMNRYEVNDMKKIVRKADPKALFLLCQGTPLLGYVEKRLIV